jgi:hypothetical protein
VKGEWVYKAEDTRLNPAVRDEVSAIVYHGEQSEEDAIHSRGASGGEACL